MPLHRFSSRHALFVLHHHHTRNLHLESTQKNNPFTWCRGLTGMESWHEPSCPRPDIYPVGAGTCCLRCGRTQVTPTDPADPADHYTLSDAGSPWASTDSLSSLEEETGLSGDDGPKNGIYDKLKPAHIRLLSIAPGGFSDEVDCDLHQEDIRYLPSYTAISYTWSDDSGDRSKKKSVFLNSRLVAVTTSCELALRRARSNRERTKVWIDAICINQNDNEEKNHQVQLMAQIYARAASVLIYIGEEAGNSSELMRRLQTGLDLGLADLRVDIGNSSEFMRGLQSGLDLGVDDLRVDVVQLLSRQYFWRIWVLQEVALARRARLICGEESIPWADFATRLREPVEFGSVAMDAFLETRDAADSWPRDLKPDQMGDIPLVLSFIKPTLRDIGELPRLLDLSTFCRATEPRDKVYALLGLVGGTDGYGFLPDYDADLETVYVRTAVLIARSCSILALLIRAVCRRSISPHLPWVPDWRYPSLYISAMPTTGTRSVFQDLHMQTRFQGGQAELNREAVASAQSIEFTAESVCSLADLIQEGGLWVAHILPAENLPARLLEFAPGKSLESTLSLPDPRILDELKSLWLFRVPPQSSAVEDGAPSSSDMDECLILTRLTCSPSSSPPGSVLELPFLGLVRFRYHTKVSRPGGVSAIFPRRPIPVRIGRQPDHETYPGITQLDLAPLGLTWATIDDIEGLEERERQLRKYREEQGLTWATIVDMDKPENRRMPWKGQGLHDTIAMFIVGCHRTYELVYGATKALLRTLEEELQLLKRIGKYLTQEGQEALEQDSDILEAADQLCRRVRQRKNWEMLIDERGTLSAIQKSRSELEKADRLWGTGASLGSSWWQQQQLKELGDLCNQLESELWDKEWRESHEKDTSYRRTLEASILAERKRVADVALEKLRANMETNGQQELVETEREIWRRIRRICDSPAES
ncbi:heterokaryon incompatibility protein-domain-containing protein [Echria macrotheca]|uniref:Heterokaryon incompatibility protein-domain-containing protein n=1 Tax=Echria macrotheca TaxID=438768 RepID=A0AAJ0FEH7_9PEZI|nr:heterokaryon incompatibility protein-domain-containing protein [Echria macrotheca]